MTDTFFGDFDIEDAYDTVPADPEQVARKLHRYRMLIESLAGRELPKFDALTKREQDDLVFVGSRIVEWVHDNMPADGFAEAIHEAGRIRRGSGEPWDRLPDDHRRLAIALAALLAGWLIRQGAWR